MVGTLCGQASPNEVEHDEGGLQRSLQRFTSVESLKTHCVAAPESVVALSGSVTRQPPSRTPLQRLRPKSVFFEFDKYTITQADGVIVTAHAKYMAGNKAAKVRLEGNADERGGREYNLSLGQKRADAVKQALELTGASAANIEAVSFGKEKPVDYSHNEDAWAKNRRVDIKYTAK